MKEYQNIVGKKSGKLTVISRDWDFKHPKRTKWICECECGRLKSVYRDAIMSGDAKSCGCLRNVGRKGINRTHGMSNTRIYKEWCYMKSRCRPNSKDSKSYYERGISVCREWREDFMSFYNWAIENGYDDSLTLDRTNNNEGYSPENCRWISNEMQQQNKVRTIYVTYNGERCSFSKLCKTLNFPYRTAYCRYRKMVKRGEQIDANKLFSPIQKRKNSVRCRKQV